MPAGHVQPVIRRSIIADRVYPNNSNNKVAGFDSWVFEPALIATESGQPGIQFAFQAQPVVHLVE